MKVQHRFRICLGFFLLFKLSLIIAGGFRLGYKQTFSDYSPPITKKHQALRHILFWIKSLTDLHQNRRLPKQIRWLRPRLDPTFLQLRRFLRLELYCATLINHLRCKYRWFCFVGDIWVFCHVLSVIKELPDWRHLNYNLSSKICFC